uniref:LRRCT domain-containing protein n=1 Tax=Periophthalmus magnuspinnatus TaxID=409849 RepID=A0A3B4B0S7_9GOBI
IAPLIYFFLVLVCGVLLVLCVNDLLLPFLDLHELSLSHNQLSRFPRGLPSSLESLLLQENRITYITTGALRYLGNLTRLDLEYNQIRAIQPGAFQGLNKLEVLTLKGNKLTNLPQNLPASLMHLDVSANCISALDLVSLSSLVNLQVLKINSNCLRSVPDSAFDTLPRLRSVNLTNNLWVCECDILYLYRWLLSGRMKMATDLFCTEPDHLAHRLLLDLSVMAICPHVLLPKTSVHNDASPKTLKPPTVSESVLKTSQNVNDKVATRLVVDDSVPSLTKTRIHPGHFTLEMLSYEDCMLLNTTPTVRPFYSETTTTVQTERGQLCRDNMTGQPSETNQTSTEETRALQSTNRESLWPTAEPKSPTTLKDSTVIIALLTLLCILVAMLMLAVLVVLKKVLNRRQRVAPLETDMSR